MIGTVQTIGIMGGGQLGRMSILAGRHMGFRFHIFEPNEGATAAVVADDATHAPYTDLNAVKAFAASVDVTTVEFENVDRAAAEMVEDFGVMRPSSRVLSVCQHRRREKEFLRASGFPCVRFEVVEALAHLPGAIDRIGLPCVVKTAAFGYDGKGQVKVAGDYDAAEIWSKLSGPEAVVVEQWVHHRAELSVVCARGADGEVAQFPMAENIHVNHILHASIAPARVPENVAREGYALAEAIATKLDLIGVLGVEFFWLDDGLVVNELAPRPHNSGHYTIEATATSQFEQHIRAVAGLPLGSTELLRPAVMVNLLGDLWLNHHGARSPDFKGLLADPTLHLHLYDKGTPRPGRKMGHFTVLDADVELAFQRAEAHYARLAFAESLR
ncbi:MAG: 5-(carboxyamino)imidazole ribonucleotide synthase [Myxococcota bacterium]